MKNDRKPIGANQVRNNLKQSVLESHFIEKLDK